MLDLRLISGFQYRVQQEVMSGGFFVGHVGKLRTLIPNASDVFSFHARNSPLKLWSCSCHSQGSCPVPPAPSQLALPPPPPPPPEEECPVPRYKRDLVQKLKSLRQELALQQPQAGHCRIEVSREEIFEVKPSMHYRFVFCFTLF